MASRGRHIASVLGRHWAAALVKARFGLAGRARRKAAFARETRAAFEELGPSFVKIGQMMSVRPDVFSPELVFEFSRLRDAVAPLDIQTVRRVIQAEFGRSPEELFEWFDGAPAASASIAQVHRARLSREARPVWGDVLPAGADVVVKVLRPGVEEAVMADLELGRRLIRRAGAFGALRRLNVDRLLEEFATSFRREIDLRREARVADRFAFDFRDDALVLIPRVVWGRTTRRVLTMEYVEGWPLSELDDARRAGVDSYGLAVHGATAFMRQVLVLGRFHADLHPANLFVTPDGRMAYLDFGIVGTLSPKEREDVAGMLAALVFRDAGRALERSAALGIKVPAAKVETVRRELGELMDRTLAGPGSVRGRPSRDGGGGTGRAARGGVRDFGLGFLALLGRHGIEIPVGYGLLVKSLVTVEGVSRALYPEIDIIEVSRPFVTHLLARQAVQPERLYARLPAAARAALRELSA